MTTRTKNNRTLIAALFLVITIDTMGVGFVWPLFGTLFTGKESTLFSSSVSMEWRNILYGITIGIASLFTFLSAPIIGGLSDQFGRRNILVCCLLCTAVGMLISAVGIIFGVVALLIFSRAWIGTTAANQAIAQATMIDISNHGNKSARIGIISSATNIGYIFGPVVGATLANSNLVDWFNLTTPFYFAAIISVFGALLLFVSFRDAGNKPKSPRLSAPRKGQTRIAKLFVFARAFTNKHLRVPAFLYLFLQLGWALYLQTNFLSLIQKHNYTKSMLGYYLAWLGIVFCFNLLITVRIVTNYVALKKIIYVSFAVATICCFMNVFYNSEFSIWLNLLFMATSIALGSNAILTTLSNIAKKDEQGWMMGVGDSLSALAWAVVPPATGVLLAFSFSFPPAIAAVLFFVGVVMGYGSRRL